MNVLKRKWLSVALIAAFCINLYPVEEQPPAEVSWADQKVPRWVAATYLITVGSVIAYLLYHRNYYFSDTPTENSGDKLVHACREGDLEKVKMFLENIDNINTVTFDYRDLYGGNGISTAPPIYFACRYGNKEIVQWMVEEKGADINVVFEKKWAYPGQDVSVTKLTLLHTAITQVRGAKRDQIIAYLIEKGVDVRARSRVSENNIGVTPLYVAWGLETIKRLLDAGALEDLESDNTIYQYSDTDCLNEGSTEKKLHKFVRARDCKEIVKELLQRGAKADAKDSKGRLALPFGSERADSPLGHLSDAAMIEILELLFEHGLDVAATDAEGNTILHNAVRFLGPRFPHEEDDPISVVEFLVQKGADIHARNNKGETPLHFACGNASVLFFNPLRRITDVVEYLISKGADLNAVSNEGKAPLDFACKIRTDVYYQPTIYIQELIDLGAQVKDEYKDGECNKHIQPLLNDHIMYRKKLKSAVEHLEANSMQKGIAREQVNYLMFNKKVPVVVKKEVLPQLLELQQKDENLFSARDVQIFREKATFKEKLLSEKKEIEKWEKRWGKAFGRKRRVKKKQDEKKLVK